MNEFLIKKILRFEYKTTTKNNSLTTRAKWPQTGDSACAGANLSMGRMAADGAQHESRKRGQFRQHLSAPFSAD